MTPIQDAPPRLVAHLRKQVLALRASCKGYDNGDSWEAERISTVVYTLAHDGNKRTQSLLRQLGLRGKLQFVSTSRGLSRMKPDTPLLAISMNDAGTTFVPFCATGVEPPWKRLVSFADWWAEPIYRSPDGAATLSRMNLVFSMRCQDGGGHVDPALSNKQYVELAEDPEPRMRITNLMGKPMPVPHAHLASMRQIGQEVLDTLGYLDL